MTRPAQHTWSGLEQIADLAARITISLMSRKALEVPARLQGLLGHIAADRLIAMRDWAQSRNSNV